MGVKVINGCSKQHEINFAHETLDMKVLMAQILMAQARRGKGAIPGMTTATNQADVGNG